MTGVQTCALPILSLGDATFDGTFTVLGSPAPTGTAFSYAKTAANVAATTVSPVGQAGLQQQPVSRVARVSSSGALDSAFALKVGTGPAGSVTAISRQSDGKLWVAGDFVGAGFGVAVSLREAMAANVAELTTLTAHGLSVGDVAVVSGVNDTADTSFDGTYTVTQVSSATVFRYVRTVGGVSAQAAVTPRGSATKGNRMLARLARLNSDGSLDSGIATDSGFNAQVNALALQTVGSTSYLLAGGDFTSYSGIGGAAHDYLVRLDTGSAAINLAFDLGTGPNAAINSLVIEPGLGGRTLVAGAFTNFYTQDSTNVNLVARINPDGNLDTSFAPPAFLLAGGTPVVNSVALDQIGRAHV